MKKDKKLIFVSALVGSLFFGCSKANVGEAAEDAAIAVVEFVEGTMGCVMSDEDQALIEELNNDMKKNNQGIETVYLKRIRQKIEVKDCKGNVVDSMERAQVISAEYKVHTDIDFWDRFSIGVKTLRVLNTCEREIVTTDVIGSLLSSSKDITVKLTTDTDGDGILVYPGINYLRYKVYNRTCNAKQFSNGDDVCQGDQAIEMFGLKKINVVVNEDFIEKVKVVDVCEEE